MGWKDCKIGDGEEYELREADHRVETDPKAVQWRFDQLVRAGYTSDEAHALASNADIDLHEAVRLVTRGCATDVACRIFGVRVEYDRTVALLAA